MADFQLPELNRAYEYLIVHATATPATMDVDAAWVDRVHKQRGWSGCGYHIVIRRDGEIQSELTGHPTRPLEAVGSHVGGCGRGWNARCLGVTMAGGVKPDGRTPENNFADAQLASLWAVIQSVTEVCDIPLDKVIGHRDLIKMTNAAPKACPCFSVQAWIAGYEPQEYEPQRAGFLATLFGREPQSESLRLDTFYRVKRGDTLWGISHATGVRVVDLRARNGLAGNHIVPGQRLKLAA